MDLKHTRSMVASLSARPGNQRMAKASGGDHSVIVPQGIRAPRRDSSVTAPPTSGSKRTSLACSTTQKRDRIPVEGDWLRRIGPAHFSHINFHGTMQSDVETFAAALVQRVPGQATRAAS